MTQVTISSTKLYEAMQGDPAIRLIDVRTPAEFRSVHASGAINIPLDEQTLATQVRDVATPQGTVYLICRSGTRGKMACKVLHEQGYQVCNVEGGTQAWETAGLPVERGQQSMSLERQVRIGAGLLVVVGVVLAAAVHPYFIGLSAFVGAGLIFAGMTDTCGMAMVLARMPWNRA